MIMKVFKFIKNGVFYVISSPTEEEAKEYVKSFDLGINNCFEVPESDWDTKNITIYEDNDFEGDSFKCSIRDLMQETGINLVSTNDLSFIL